MIYFVDFENVGSNGLIGSKNLSDKDKVIVFMNKDRVKSIPVDVYMEMMNTSAKVEHIFLHKSGKNYLDFQLSTYLGYLLGKGEKNDICIVSKDAGYESLVDFWKGRNISICIQPSIGNVKPVKKTKSDSTKEFTELWRKKIRESLKKNKLTVASSSYSSIYRAIVENDSKLGLHNTLAKSFKDPMGLNIYNAIKDIFEEYQSSKK